MQEFRVTVDSLYHTHTAFTPDGRFLAVGAKAFTLIDTVAGTLREFPEMPRPYWGFAFVRAGAELAHSPLILGLQVIDLASGQAREWKLQGGYARCVAARPDADQFFTAVRIYGGKTTLRAVAVADFAERAAFAEMNDTVDRLVISADGRWLAGKLLNALRVWYVAGEKLPTRAAVTKQFVGCDGFALSADGALLVAANSRGLAAWHTKTGRVAFHSGKHRRGVTAVACCPTRSRAARRAR